ncbi:hypothetical protein GALL_230800 [mine drainage metagenome]|jgi:hypothetical protein|uniref:Uncharacterized protein n=1 Tax=mine drainage metagenome TaxID=410659 RepID=A0A1J5RGU7_9ZZZZ
MTALTLLDRLSGVKRTGPRYPVHDDCRVSVGHARMLTGVQLAGMRP